MSRCQPYQKSARAGDAQSGRDGEVLKNYDKIREAGLRPGIGTVLTILKACGKRRDLSTGERIHRDMLENGDCSNVFVANTLIDMYAKCGSLSKALEVFEQMPHHNLVSWNCVILGHAQCGEGNRALKLFRRMQEEGFEPDAVTFIAAVKACSYQEASRCLELGKTIHSEAVKRDLDMDIFVASSLVDMYSKCGSTVNAREVFDKVQVQSVVLWNSMITGYAQNGENSLALEMFLFMQQSGFQPDAVTFVALAKSVGNLAEQENGRWASKCLDRGRYLNLQAAGSGYELNVFVANTLVDMYRKCKSMLEARSLFERMPQRNAVTWNCLMLAYAEAGDGREALALYSRMECKPNNVTFVAALKACASLAETERDWCFEQGRAVHLRAAKHEVEMDMFVASSLVDMYAKCGRMSEAYHVFQRMQKHDVVCWNTIVTGFCQNGDPQLALHLYELMQARNFTPDSVTLLAALRACAQLAEKEEAKLFQGKRLKTESLKKGRALHFHAVNHGHMDDNFVANSIVHMYAKCGSMLEARRVFEKMKQPNVVSWTHVILGYAENGEPEQGLQVYRLMQQGPCRPDCVTLMAALKACAAIAELEQGKLLDGKPGKAAALEAGKAIHSEAVKRGFELDMFVASSLVDTYAKCGSMKDASNLFERMHQHDVVSWNCLIMGYVQTGENNVALEAFALMKDRGFVPSCGTYLAVLKACGSFGVLETGRQVHCEICNAGLDSSASLVCSLIDFYGKCGSMGEAEQVFDAVAKDDLVIWNSLITGYSRQGDTERVFELFRRIQDKLRPDDVTFLTLLTVCSHAGLVAKGCEYFELMAEYGVNPGLEHYACMVDLLGQADKLEDAAIMLKRMRVRDVQLWLALLGAAWKCKNVEVCRLAFETVVETGDVVTSAAYVCMSNLYATAQMECPDAAYALPLRKDVSCGKPSKS